METVDKHEVWLVAQEYTWDLGDGGRPELAYLLPAAFPKSFPSFEAAHAFIKEMALPLGWTAQLIASFPK